MGIPFQILLVSILIISLLAAAADAKKGKKNPNPHKHRHHVKKESKTGKPNADRKDATQTEALANTRTRRGLTVAPQVAPGQTLERPSGADLRLLKSVTPGIELSALDENPRIDDNDWMFSSGPEGFEDDLLSEPTFWPFTSGYGYGGGRGIYGGGYQRRRRPGYVVRRRGWWPSGWA